jgi:hypothetical protein
VISTQEIAYDVELPRKVELAPQMLPFHIDCHTVGGRL